MSNATATPALPRPTLAARVTSRVAARTNTYPGRRTQRTLAPLSSGSILRVALEAALDRSAPWSVVVRHGGSVPNCYKYPAVTDRQAVGAVRLGGTVFLHADSETVPANKVTEYGALRNLLGEPWAGSPRYGMRTDESPVILFESLMSRAGGVPASISVRALRRAVLPRGWRLGRDAQGIVLTRPDGHEYHPSTGDLSAANPAVRIAAAAAETYAARQAEEARQTAQRETAARLRLLAAPDVSVTIADSDRAGNCAAGRDAFRVRHGFAGRTCATVAELRRVARHCTPDTATRIEAAITAAAACQLVATR
jgi:hypothetical protein